MIYAGFLTAQRPNAKAKPWLLFTAAIEIYYVISFRFRLIRRNWQNFVFCRNPLNEVNAKESHMQPKWGVEGVEGTE
jgi:hypothetical protein